MSDPADINPDRGHLKPLDGVRGLAVLMVMVFHFFQREAFASTSRIVHALDSVSHIGQTGVDLFFVLSGFLITGILLHGKQTPGYFRNFYARRALRIFPLAYGALLFVYLILPLAHATSWTPWHQQLWFWLYASNIHDTFSNNGIRGPGHFWSLAIEEQFYLVWPTIVWLCTRRSLYAACIACLIVSLAMRLVLIRSGYSVFSFTLCRLDALAMGALLANFVRGPGGRAALARLRPHLWLAALVIALVPVWISLTGRADKIAQIAKYPMTALLYCALLAAALDPLRPAIGRIFSTPVLTTFGKYSYGLYVWDGILQPLLSPFVSSRALSPHLPGVLHQGIALIAVGALIQLPISFAAALLSWNLFEKHFLKLKRFFEYDARRSAATIGAPSWQFSRESI